MNTFRAKDSEFSLITENFIEKFSTIKQWNESNALRIESNEETGTTECNLISICNLVISGIRISAEITTRHLYADYTLTEATEFVENV